jgi:phage terminase large subunit-like protein
MNSFDQVWHRLWAMPSLRHSKPRGSKVERLQAQTAVMEAGLVFLPTSAAWKEDYLFELMLLPAGRYDDQVDSTSQALGWFANNNGPARCLAMMDEFYRERGRGSGPDS